MYETIIFLLVTLPNIHRFYFFTHGLGVCWKWINGIQHRLDINSVYLNWLARDSTETGTESDVYDCLVVLELLFRLSCFRWTIIRHLVLFSADRSEGSAPFIHAHSLTNLSVLGLLLLNTCLYYFSLQTASRFQQDIVSTGSELSFFISSNRIDSAQLHRLTHWFDFLAAHETRRGSLIASISDARTPSSTIIVRSNSLKFIPCIRTMPPAKPSCAKAAEPIETPCGGTDYVGSGNHAVVGTRIKERKGNFMRNISRPTVIEVQAISGVSQLSGRWQQRCGLSLPVAQQLVVLPS